MRRIALTVRADAVEDVLDRLLPLLPQGVHPADVDDGVELAIFGGDAAARPSARRLAGDALLAVDEQEAPDDPRERRRRFGRTWEVGGRFVVRPPEAPASAGGLPELVIDSPAGAFGTGAHPTTRMCLELLLDLEPGGGFADLGCGAGVLAIAAGRARLTAGVRGRPRGAQRRGHAAQRRAQRRGGRGAAARPARRHAAARADARRQRPAGGPSRARHATRARGHRT